MGIGTSVGGWRIIRTMGMRTVKLEPHQGFAAETGAAMSIELASRLEIPVSTTYTISTAIMGVGASRKGRQPTAADDRRAVYHQKPGDHSRRAGHRQQGATSVRYVTILGDLLDF